MIPHGPDGEIAVIVVFWKAVPVAYSARRGLPRGGESALDGAEAAVATGRAARSVAESFQAMQHLRRRMTL